MGENLILKPVEIGEIARFSGPGLRCFYCNKLGHIRARCLKRRRDMRTLSDNGNGISADVRK